MNSPAISASAKTNRALPYWVTEKVDEAKAKGYGFCLIYVEPENHDKLCEELATYDLAGHNIRLYPARGSDLVRQADGVPDHMPVMLKWAEPIVIERSATAGKSKPSRKATSAGAAAASDEASGKAVKKSASKKAGAKKSSKKSAAKKKSAA